MAAKKKGKKKRQIKLNPKGLLGAVVKRRKAQKNTMDALFGPDQPGKRKK